MEHLSWLNHVKQLVQFSIPQQLYSPYLTSNVRIQLIRPVLCIVWPEFMSHDIVTLSLKYFFLFSGRWKLWQGENINRTHNAAVNCCHWISAAKTATTTETDEIKCLQSVNLDFTKIHCTNPWSQILRKRMHDAFINQFRSKMGRRQPI